MDVPHHPLITGSVTDVMINRGYAEVLAYRMAFVSASVLTLLGVIILGVMLWTMRGKGQDRETVKGAQGSVVQ